MFCPNCGKEVPEGAKFCDNCGTPIPVTADSNANVDNNIPANSVQPHVSQQAEPVQQPQPVPQPQVQVTQQTAPKKSGSKVPMIIGIVAVVIICLFGAVMLFGGSDSESSAVGSNDVIELSQYVGYPEEEIAALLGVEVNPEGAYPSLDNCNFMCVDNVEMIYINADNEGDEKYSLFGIRIGTKESDIPQILGSDFEYSEKNSYDMDGYSFRWYDDVKTGGVLMINCEDSKVTDVSYFSGDSLQAAANDDLAFFGLEDDYEPSGSGVEDEAYMEYVKNYLSDFNEVRAADMDSFTDTELLEIYNDLMERIKRVDKENIGIDGMRSILSTSELQIMSEQTAENLPDNVILDLYEELCEHENDTDGTWFAEMRELYGLSSGDYIIPDSDSRYLSASDLSGLTKDELRIARNEIYARHGRIFDSADLAEYFNSKDWYNGTIPGASFSDSMLNDYEKKNAELIRSVENGTSSGSGKGQPKGEVTYRTKMFDGNIYGSYEMYNPSNGYTYKIEIGFFTDGPIDTYITLDAYPAGSSEPSEDLMLNLVNDRGNMYEAIDEVEWSEGLPNIEIIFNEDASQVSAKASSIVAQHGYDIFDGIYDAVSKVDLRHVG